MGSPTRNHQPLEVEDFCWNLHLFCFDSQTLLSWNYYLWELIKYVGHIAFMSLTYYLWKVLLKWFNLVIHCFLSINYRKLFWIISFTSYALHYYLDQDYVGCMSHQKLFCNHLPTRGRVEVKLGDDMCQTYLLFLINPC